MRRGKFVLLTGLLLVVCMAITPQTAEAAGGASPILNLKGLRIPVWYPVGGEPPVHTISADEYAHVHHGWRSEGQYDPKVYWSEFSGREKAEFIRTSTFELSIDDDPIKLSRAQWYNRELDFFFVIYYIEFKPGDLAPGTYSFTGIWYSEVYGEPFVDDRGTCPISITVTVIVE